MERMLFRTPYETAEIIPKEGENKVSNLSRSFIFVLFMTIASPFASRSIQLRIEIEKQQVNVKCWIS